MRITVYIVFWKILYQAFYQIDIEIKQIQYADLRDDKQFFIDHPGLTPITAMQACLLVN